MQIFSGEIKYRVVRTPPKKTVSMRVHAVKEGGIEVVVRASSRVSSSFIDSFLKERSGWISTQVSRIERSCKDAREALPADAPILSKTEVRALFTGRYLYMLSIFGIEASKAPRLSVRAMSSRWGSFRSGTYSIALNSELSKTPVSLLDYVIAHELAHMAHLNHSPQFYAELGRFMPDWKSRRRALRILEPALLGQHRNED